MFASRDFVERLDGAVSVAPPSAARAHAIKNCISAVRAINRLIEPEVSERGRQRLARSQAAVDRMLALLEADLAPPGIVGAVTGTFLRVDQVMDEVIARVADGAAAEGVKLVVDCGSGGVFGDPEMLIEAIQNLVTNAIEASADGGCVVVKTEELRDASQAWTVTDRGLGIPSEMLARLGTPFVTSREGGSGLGFAVARSVIEHHGGIIRVESEADAGTTVSIWLPAPSGRRTAVELVALLDDMVEALTTETHQVGWLHRLAVIRAEIEYGVLRRSYVDEAMLARSCRELLDLVAGPRCVEFVERYASACASSPAVQSLHDRTIAVCRRLAGDRYLAAPTGTGR